MSDKLVITSVTGGGDGPDLVGCYFKTKSDGTVDFYDKDNNRKKTGLSVDSNFSVTLDEDPSVTFNLSITQFSIQGSWSDGNSEVEGTYQAQASGTGADEEESASSAKA